MPSAGPQPQPLVHHTATTTHTHHHAQTQHPGASRSRKRSKKQRKTREPQGSTTQYWHCVAVGVSKERYLAMSWMADETAVITSGGSPVSHSPGPTSISSASFSRLWWRLMSSGLGSGTALAWAAAHLMGRGRVGKDPGGAASGVGGTRGRVQEPIYDVMCAQAL